MSKKFAFTACALALSGLALAKLPPQDDAAKAKAAETAAKAAWQAKVDAFQLCKVQDRIAAQYRGKTAKVAGTVTTAGTVTGVTTPTTPTVATTGATAPAATAAPATAA
ncbi:MAG TPA: hypothetical protein VNB23_10400, partial [Ramlibacter sp.]|nr:hypothetical protein [Ramlibacter sp.]